MSPALEHWDKIGTPVPGVTVRPGRIRIAQQIRAASLLRRCKELLAHVAHTHTHTCFYQTIIIANGEDGVCHGSMVEAKIIRVAF